MSQKELQDICEAIVDEVDGALGCSLVDLGTGLPMALDVKPNTLLSAQAMEVMSAAGATYFRENVTCPWVPASAGPGTRRAAGRSAGRATERATGRAAEAATETATEAASETVQEIQATTEETYHFMALVPDKESELLVLVTERKSTNLGLGWIAVRHALKLLRDAYVNVNADVDASREANDGRELNDTGEVNDDRIPTPGYSNGRPATRPNSHAPNAGARGRRTIWGQR